LIAPLIALNGTIADQSSRAIRAGDIPNCRARIGKFTGIITTTRAAVPKTAARSRRDGSGPLPRRNAHAVTATKVPAAIKSATGPKGPFARNSRKRISLMKTTIAPVAGP